MDAEYFDYPVSLVISHYENAYESNLFHLYVQRQESQMKLQEEKSSRSFQAWPLSIEARLDDMMEKNERAELQYKSDLAEMKLQYKSDLAKMKAEMNEMRMNFDTRLIELEAKRDFSYNLKLTDFFTVGRDGRCLILHFFTIFSRKSRR